MGFFINLNYFLISLILVNYETWIFFSLENRYIMLARTVRDQHLCHFPVLVQAENKQLYTLHCSLSKSP